MKKLETEKHQHFKKIETSNDFIAEMRLRFRVAGL